MMELVKKGFQECQQMNENMFPLDSTPDYETSNIVSDITPNDESSNVVSDRTISDDYSSDKGVLLLARAFLSIDSMTHKKLQKLCFYAKAWYLALYDENIITEDFQAWVHGAVQPELYQNYRQYGFLSIPKNVDFRGIPETYLNFAKEIYNSYGHLSGDELERLNHSEEPWIKARKGLNPWQNSNEVISEDDMKNYYRGIANNG